MRLRVYNTHNKYEGEKWEKELGKKKCRYKIYKEKGPYDFTILGMQKGDWLVKCNDIDILSEEEGILSAKDFKRKAFSWRKFIGAIPALLGLFFIGLGVNLVIQEKESWNSFSYYKKRVILI